MGYDNPDVYYQPEAFDLVPVAELALTEPDYSFDIVMVWRHTPTGELYWAQDSGCSCPSPFEDYTSLDKLEVVCSYEDMVKFVERADNAMARAQFLRKVWDAMLN
jgi:hypothetical protein